MTDEYTYIVHTPDEYADALHPTRHDAVGERAILEAIHPSWDLQIRVRRRYATDPV